MVSAIRMPDYATDKQPAVDTSAMTPYNTMGILGGIIGPIVDAAVTAALKSSSKASVAHRLYLNGAKPAASHR